MAIEYFRIPLSPNPQRFQITLSGIEYTFINRWSSAMSLWTFSLLTINVDTNIEEMLITNMPLVTGTDLLEQWEFLKIPGQLFCYTAGDQGAPPTFDNLGGDSNLYYISDEE